MRIGDITAETGVRLPRVTVEEQRPAVKVKMLPTKVEVEEAHVEVAKAPPVEVRKIESVTKSIDSFLRSIGRSINFRVDPGSGRTIVSVVDATTGEVIRQVPGEDALKLAEKIEASLSAFIDEHA
jgi:uncharacterized FlaG/YvyC family protein